MDWNSCSVTTRSGEAIPTLSCVFLIFQTVLTWALTFATTVALFLIIYAGIKFITSGGDPKQLDTAKKTFTYTIIGLVLIFFSFLIINVIAYVTGVGCLRLMGFSACK